MDKQLLKDFLETAKQNNYDYDVVMPLFPELEGVDLQLLKDYAETAEQNNYDYDVVNSLFPELFEVEAEVKKKKILHLLHQIKMWSWIRKTLHRIHKQLLKLQSTNHRIYLSL